VLMIAGSDHCVIWPFEDLATSFVVNSMLGIPGEVVANHRTTEGERDLDEVRLHRARRKGAADGVMGWSENPMSTLPLVIDVRRLRIRRPDTN